MLGGNLTWAVERVPAASILSVLTFASAIRRPYKGFRTITSDTYGLSAATVAVVLPVASMATLSVRRKR